MSLQNPAALGLFLPLAGLILLLYLLKMRRRDMRVPATFLWPAKTEEIRANALFQKLRPSWLLLLQLLALGLAVVCIAKPQSRQTGLAGEVTVFVIDTSASMQATDVKPSRLGEAKKLAKEAILSAKPGDRIALIEGGPTPRVVFPLSNDSAKQLPALEALQPSDAESDIGEALRLSSAVVGGIDGARIVLLSDGCFEKVTNFSRGKAALVYRSIGEQDDNLSVSSLGITETPKGRQLFVGVKSFSNKPMEGVISIYADGKPIDSTKLQVNPNNQWAKTMSAPPGAKVFEAKLDAPDILKSDNYAVAIADPGAKLHVLLIGKGDMFLERALALDPRVTLDRADQLPTDGAATYDIVVFDGVEEQPVKARGVLTFGSAGSNPNVEAHGSAKNPTFTSSEKSPLLAGVNLRDVFIDQMEKVSAQPAGKVLAQSNQGPLVVSSESTTKRQLYVAFEPMKSDFPLQVGFPIFIANALDFLGGQGGTDILAVRVGAPFSVPTTKPATLTSQEGSKQELKPVNGAVIVRDIRQVGKYNIEVSGKKRPIYASLRSEIESNVAPHKNLKLGGGDVKAVASPLRFADFWRPLGLLCLAILGAEWWLFARRS